MRLVPQTDVTLGPGSLVELRHAQAAPRLLGRGEDRRRGQGPRGTARPRRAEGHGQGDGDLPRHDARSEKLVRLEKEPLWLKRLRGQTVNESIGSLVAKVDGRNVPLTVGYHKVTVDIRDQIARTVIEESFVNHTDGAAGGRVLLPAAAGRLDLRLRHVDRRRAGRGRRGREAAGPRNLRDDPPRAARPGPAGMVRRQHLQGPRVPHRGALREADQDHLHAGPAAAGRHATATATPCRARCSSSTRCASCRST